MPESFTYQAYLDRLPPERREAVTTVWETVRRNLGEGFTETAEERFLTIRAEGEWYVALASQKRYLSLYLMPIYVYPELDELLNATGMKVKRGKSCINFQRAEDLPLEVIGRILAAHDAAEYAAHVRHVRGRR